MDISIQLILKLVSIDQGRAPIVKLGACQQNLAGTSSELAGASHQII